MAGRHPPRAMSKGRPSPAVNPSRKAFTQEAEGTSRSTRPSRSYRSTAVGRVSKQQGSRQKAHRCSEKVRMVVQDMNNTLPVELPPVGTPKLPAGSVSSPYIPGAEVQHKIENIKKVVSEVAGIRWRKSGGGENWSSP